MDYFHINEKLVSSTDKKYGTKVTLEGRNYDIIGYELYTNDFIVIRHGKNSWL